VDIITMSEERKKQILMILAQKYPEQFEIPEEGEPEE